jgi:hypothetical protein
MPQSNCCRGSAPRRSRVGLDLQWPVCPHLLVMCVSSWVTAWVHIIIVDDDFFVRSTSSIALGLDNPATPSVATTIIDKPRGTCARGRGWKGKGCTTARGVMNGHRLSDTHDDMSRIGKEVFGRKHMAMHTPPFTSLVCSFFLGEARCDRDGWHHKAFYATRLLLLFSFSIHCDWDETQPLPLFLPEALHGESEEAMCGAWRGALRGRWYWMRGPNNHFYILHWRRYNTNT